jgi:CRISPR-associated endonuclease/helicase Cas3
MTSDLAPVDLLMQRAGRLHRHLRERPIAHREPVLHVAGLLPDALPDMKGTAWGFVYDTYILGRTWALLRGRGTVALPGDIDRLVQQVYAMDEPLPDDLDNAVREAIEVDALGEWLARVKSERQRAFNIVIPPDAEPDAAYIGKPAGREEDELGLGLENTTRLGPESITLVPVIEGDDGRWHVQPEDAGFLPDQVLDAGTARALYNRQIKVSRKAVVAHFGPNKPPHAFESHALLRSMRPLLLIDGRCAVGRQSLRLHPELGLVYETDGPNMPRPTQEEA